MKSSYWKNLKQEIAMLRVGLVPGCTVLFIVILVRLAGFLQPLEWLAFDTFLRVRPDELRDERITIIGIDEADINLYTYPIPDAEIAKLLDTINSYKPRVIGLDIFKNTPQEPGYGELINSFKNIKNLIAIDKVLPDPIPPPPSLPPEQVAFADAILDADGHLRRGLLGTPITNEENYKFSLPLRLAEVYLSQEGIHLDTGIKDPEAMRFGKTELPRFLRNYGGYVGTDAGGVQILLNYRKSKQPFRMLSLNDIKTRNFNPDWLRDKIVLIGMTATSVKDIVNVSPITGMKSAPGLAYGVEIQAHTCSQIVNAVLANRPLFKVWADGWEYIWIIVWGMLGIILSRLTQSPLKNIIGVGIASFTLVGFSYLVLLAGWWIPIVPTLLVFVVNGIVLIVFYQYDRSLRLQIEERELIIENTFDMIHNGPLQTLAKLLRSAKEAEVSPAQLVEELTLLNHELRAVYESIKQENLTGKDSVALGEGLALDLQAPIHEILYGVYSQTLKRDFPCFKTLKVKVRSFDPIDVKHLTIDQKRGLCRFLEEALCNVGKYAVGATRLTVTCTAKDGWNILSIIDNGHTNETQAEGRGTQQSKNLARQLKGEFRRQSLLKKGTVCELSWPISKPRQISRISRIVKTLQNQLLKFD